MAKFKFFANSYYSLTLMINKITFYGIKSNTFEYNSINLNILCLLFPNLHFQLPIPFPQFMLIVMEIYKYL